MKLKKLLAVALSVITACTCLSFAACSEPAVQNDGKTVNVMMQLSGYGTAYVEDVARKFEEVYAEEGYKINLLDARSSFSGASALTEMRLDYEKSGIDLVMTGGVTIKQCLDEEYGACIDNLDDVYNNGAINFDGSVDPVPIKDKYKSEYSLERMRHSDGHYYTFSTTDGVRGLVYNEKVLKRYGIETYPVTTDELFEMFDIIYNGNAQVQGIRPVTWGGDNAAAYALGTLYLGIAQLIGTENFQEFFELDYLLNEDGTIKADGYKFFEDYAPELEAVLETLIQKFDVLYSYTGSKTQLHTKAHAQLVTGKTAFMQDGQYFYTEVMNDFPTYLNDIRMAPNPIVSYLGEKLKLDGTGNDKAKCDDILSFMCKSYDDGVRTSAELESKTEAQFPGVDITTEQCERIMEARSAYFGALGSSSYVLKQSPVKDIAKLFIRMMHSEDVADIYAKYGMFHSFGKADESLYAHQFVKDAAKLIADKNYIATSVLKPGTVRANTNMFLLPMYNANIVLSINNEMGTPEAGLAARNYTEIAKTVLTNVQNHAKENWAKLIGNGGYELGN